MVKISKEKLHKIIVESFMLAIILGIIFLGVTIAKLLLPKYSYVDMNGSAGISNNCYYDESSRDLRCMIPVKVQQYNKE